MRKFPTGATRDTDDTKLDFDGFLSHAVLTRYAQYLDKHRVQSDGNVRDSDNWQKGIPRTVYMKSAWRHFMEWWGLHRNPVAYGVNEPCASARQSKDLEEAICAVIFNAMGYLHEHLKERRKDV